MTDRRFLLLADLTTAVKAVLAMERGMQEIMDTLTTPPVEPPTVQNVLAALERFEGNRARLVVQPVDQDRVQAALDQHPLGGMVKVQTSELVPDGQAYLINTQAINEAIKRRTAVPPNAAVMWNYLQDHEAVKPKLDPTAFIRIAGV